MSQNYNYTDEFKRKISELRESGKSVNELAMEYGLAKSTVSTWHKQFKNSGSFRAKDNLSAEAKELKQLQKELKRLKMENDILKQAALILGRNGK
jgi:transposase